MVYTTPGEVKSFARIKKEDLGYSAEDELDSFISQLITYAEGLISDYTGQTWDSQENVPSGCEIRIAPALQQYPPRHPPAQDQPNNPDRRLHDPTRHPRGLHGRAEEALGTLPHADGEARGRSEPQLHHRGGGLDLIASPKGWRGRFSSHTSQP
jgi:hypothetical protein